MFFIWNDYDYEPSDEFDIQVDLASNGKYPHLNSIFLPKDLC